MTRYDNFPEDQPFLPGMSDMDLALNQVYTAEQATYREEQRRPTISEADLAQPVQRAVLQQYERSVLRPREQLWHDTTQFLLADRPSRIEIKKSDESYRPLRGKLSWDFLHFDQERGLEVVTTVSAKANLGYGNDSDKPGMVEMRHAMQYLVDGKSALPNGKTPDELLDVGATGLLLTKRIPRDLLESTVTERVVAGAHKLKITVSARPLGSSKKPETGMDFEVSNRTWDNPGEYDGWYMKPKHAYNIYSDLRLGSQYYGRAPIPDPTLGDVYDFLYDMYCAPGVGEEFRKLSEVNGLLGVSSCVPMAPCS